MDALCEQQAPKPQALLASALWRPQQVAIDGILDPDMVVLGGGVSNFGEIYSDGVEQVRQFIFTDEMQTPIVKNQLGDSAGVLGAALVGI